MYRIRIILIYTLNDIKNTQSNYKITVDSIKFGVKLF